MQTLSDAQLVARLVSGLPGNRRAALDSQELLEAELTRRCSEPARRAALQRLLEGYALGADEYLGEDAQAAARHYLAALR